MTKQTCVSGQTGFFPELGPAVLEESLASGVLLTVGLNPLKSDVMVRSWTAVAVASHQV